MEVLHGDIRLTLTDADAIRGMRRAKSAVERGLKEISGKEALVKIEADLKDYEKEIKRAQRMLKKWQGLRAEATLTADKRQADIQIKRAMNALTKWEGRKATAELDLKGAKETLQLQQKMIALQSQRGAQADRLATAEQRAARTQIALNEKQAVQERERTMRIAKLQQEYDKAYQAAQKLASTGRVKRAVSPDARLRADIDMRRFQGQMAVIRSELEALEANPVEIDVNLSTSKIAEQIAGIGEVGMRLGPFTGTLKQFSKAALILGPILTGLVGSVAALAGALGTGLVGAAGLAGAGMAGFGMVLGGVFAALKPLGAEINFITKAQSAYDKAVREHGEGSKEAAKKLKVLQSVTAHVSAEAREGYKALGGLNERWAELTRSSRDAGLDTVGRAVKNLSAMMPLLASNTNNATQALSTGVNRWMSGISSVEGQTVIARIMGNTNEALDPLMRGLGSLGAALGRVTASFSRHFAPLLSDFAAWTAGLNTAAANTSRLDAGVDRLVDSFRDVLGVGTAFGRVIKEFSLTAMGPGGDFMDDLASGLNSVADGIAADRIGENNLGKFMRDSVETTERLYHALKPLLQLFLEFSTILRPATNAMLSIIAPMGELTEFFVSLGPIRTALQAWATLWLFKRTTAGAIALIAASVNGLAAALARLGKAQATNALGGVATSLAGARGATLAAPIGRGIGKSNNLANATSTATAAGGGAAAARSVGAISKLGAAASAASVGLLGVSAPVAALGAAAIGGAIGIKALIDSSNKTKDQDRRTERLTGVDPNANVRPVMGRGATFANSQHQAERKELMALADQIARTNQLRQQGGVAQREMAAAFSILSRSQLTVKESERAYAEQVKATGRNSLEAKVALQNLRDARREEAEAARQWSAVSGTAASRVSSALRTAEKAWLSGSQGPARDALWKNLLRARDAAEAFRLNVTRAKNGLDAFTGPGADAIGRFSRTFAAIPAVKRFLVKVEDQGAAEKVAALGTRLANMGRKSTVTKILADSGSAEEAIRRLRNMLAEYGRQSPEAKLRANLTDARTKLENVNRDLRRYGRQAPEALLKARDDARRKIESLERQLAELDGKESDVNVNVKFKLPSDFTTDTTGSAAGSGDGWGVPNIKGSVAKFAKRNAGKLSDMMGMGGGGPLGSMAAAGSGLNAFNKFATRFGLTIGSGFRPGSITSSGNRSYHSMGRARDFPGPPGAMMKFARFMASTFGRRLKELIYTPLGFSIKNGKRVAPYAQSDHYDHVHVAMAKGGRVRPGRYSQPNVLFAEEQGHPEYFISTNPRDRRRSQKLVLQAAEETGLMEHRWTAMAGGGRTSPSGFSIAGIRGRKNPNLSARQVAILARAAGFKGRQLVEAIMIAFAESNFNMRAKSANPSGGTNMGLMQIDSGSHKDATYDPLGNMKAAYRISGGGKNWGPWEAHGNKKYRSIEAEARKAAIWSRTRGVTTAGGEAGGVPGEVTEVPTHGAKRTMASIMAAAQGRLDMAMTTPDFTDDLNVLMGHSFPKLVPKRVREARLRRAVKAQKSAQRFKLGQGMSAAAGTRANELDERARKLGDIAARTHDRQVNPGLISLTKRDTRKANDRLHKIDKALKKPLTRDTRERLLQEKEGLIQQVAGNRTKLVELEKQAAEGQFEIRQGGNNRLMNDYRTALAASTQNLDDDLAAAEAERNYYAAREQWAKERGDIAGATEARNAFNSANERIKQITQQQGQDRLAEAEAMAGLTPQLEDDIAAAKMAENYWQQQLFFAHLANDPAGIAQAATALKGARDQIVQITRQREQDRLSAAEAQASLSDNLDDDLAAAQMAADYWGWQLHLAHAAGDSAGIAQAASALKTARDQMKDISNRMALIPVELAQSASALTFDLSDDVAAARMAVEYYSMLYATTTGAEKAAAGASLASAQSTLRDAAETAKRLPLERDRALAALTEDTKDDERATVALRDYWANRLEEAKNQGDIQGQIDAAGNLKTLNDEIKEAERSIATQLISLSDARRDLYRSFGSNFILPTNVVPQLVQAATSAPAAVNYNPGDTKPGNKAGTTVNQNITMYAPPPDPHTWSHNVAWELQAAV